MELRETRRSGAINTVTRGNARALNAVHHLQFVGDCAVETGPDAKQVENLKQALLALGKKDKTYVKAMLARLDKRYGLSQNA